MVKRCLFSFFLFSSFCTVSAPEQKAQFALDEKSYQLDTNHKTSVALNIAGFGLGCCVGALPTLYIGQLLEEYGLLAWNNMNNLIMAGFVITGLLIIPTLLLLWYNKYHEHSSQGFFLNGILLSILWNPYISILLLFAAMSLAPSMIACIPFLSPYACLASFIYYCFKSKKTNYTPRLPGKNQKKRLLSYYR